MNENEIMSNNEEIIETVAEEAVKVSNGSFKSIATFGLGALVGVVIYKYIAKPAVDRYRERRATKASISANPEVYQEDIVDDEDNVID